MKRCLTIAVACCVVLWNCVQSASALTEEEKRAQTLRHKLEDSTGLLPEHHNFSKESDEELLQMADTIKKDRANLTPEKGNTGPDSWNQFEKDLHKELDRRGRTPDGKWKKSYNEADAIKWDINRELNQNIRSQQNTRDVDQKPKAGDKPAAPEAQGKPNGTQALDPNYTPPPRNRDFEKANTVTSPAEPAPKNSAFEKAETVATERPPPSTVTSNPEPHRLTLPHNPSV